MSIVHPATWFKVEFPDKRVVTFRPSALRPLNDDGEPLVPSLPKHTPRAPKEEKKEAAAVKRTTTILNMSLVSLILCV